MPFLLANWRILLLGAIILSLGIQTWRLDRCQTKFEEFRISTEALGRAQKAKNEADAKFNQEVVNETIAAKDAAISDLSTRYAAARKLLNRPRGGSVQPTTPPATIVAACESEGGSAERLADLEARILDLLERADKELAKYNALWEWSQKVR